MTAALPSEFESTENRRNSFRLDDTVSLRIRILDEESIAAICKDFDAFRLRYGLKSHMLHQTELRKPTLIRLKKSNPDIAEYLEGLERQITQLAERIDQIGDVSEDVAELSCEANLSANGIRFSTDMAISKGQTLEIGLDLSTQAAQVVMLGEVLRVDANNASENTVSVQYTHIHLEDSEAIIRHLAKLQQYALQARRGLQ